MSDLQIEDDAPFQRREWQMERAGWAGLMVLVIAAAAGAFGGGPLSNAHASDETGQLVVHYERFVRASAPAELRMQLLPATATDGEAAVWIDAAYWRDLEVSSVVPEPSRVEQRGQRIVYVFSMIDGADPAEIVFRYRPMRAGRLEGRFGVSDGVPAAVRQFAFF